MELMAPIVALSTLTEKSHVTIFSDSQYVVNPIAKGWIYKWRENRWKGSDGLPVKNLDLWQILLPYVEFHDVTFAWVRGHTGIPENERCDILAKENRMKPMYRDAGFAG
jgi:ribonuclease HI